MPLLARAGELLPFLIFLGVVFFQFIGRLAKASPSKIPSPPTSARPRTAPAAPAPGRPSPTLPQLHPARELLEALGQRVHSTPPPVPAKIRETQSESAPLKLEPYIKAPAIAKVARLEATPAASPAPSSVNVWAQKLQSPEHARDAMILMEIFSPPLALRSPVSAVD